MKGNIKKYVSQRLKEKPVIVEVGAHYGEDSLDFLRVMNPSSVHCFEPDPRNIYIFKKHIRDSRIFLYEYAVSGDDEDVVDFHLSHCEKIHPTMFDKYNWIDKDDYINMKLNASGSSSLKKGHPLLDDGEVVSVRTIRLDTWAKDNGISQIDFLWIDVQGAERDVAKGMGNITGNIKCVWVEFGEDGYEGYMTLRETIRLFEGMGFSLDNKKSSKGKKGNLLFWRH